MPNLTIEFADLIIKVSQNKITDEVAECVTYKVLDYIGCAAAGTSINSQKMKILVDNSGQGNVPVIGSVIKLNNLSAALMNGINAHKTELDDGHRIAMLHPGVPVISALLSYAYTNKINGYDFVRGIVAGYETTVRLGEAIQPGHKLKGFHATGSCGTIGAAVSIAIAAHYSQEQLLSTLSAASTSACGLLEMIDDDSEIKPYNAGRAALDGLASALIGKANFIGPKDPLGGKRGFFAGYCENINTENLLSNETLWNKSKLKIFSCYQKPFAACRHCHAPIEAILQLRNKHKIKASEVKKITIKTYKLAILGHESAEINSISAAKMSIPFSVAIAFVTGRANLDEFSERYLFHSEVKDLMKKVFIVESPELTIASPDKRGAIVEVLTEKDIFSITVDYPLGEPENPLTSTLLIQKFKELCEFSGIEKKIISSVILHTANLKNDFELFLESLSSLRRVYETNY
ncbi:MAG: MmgE/PrpD family protein [Lachnospiraceae bacterium]|nr:MmgE/PrpD family protein [Lachnospiraceae bacterium]